MKIAITGGIGSGKSFVVSRLRGYGIEVYDTDSNAKRLMLEDEEIRRKLERLIAPNVYFLDGTLNKPLVAKFLLASKSNAKRLNAIVHPVVARDFLLSGIDWMECAILFEAQFDRLVDKVICVQAPTDVRVERIMQRDGITQERALEWINCQMPQPKMQMLSDYTVLNDGRTDVAWQLEKILQDLDRINKNI